MKKEEKRILLMFVRYTLLILIAIPGMKLFYEIFLPLTKYPIYFFIHSFYPAVLLQNAIFVGQRSIELIDACIAGSAYYLLLTLNFATPKLNFKKRLSLVLFSFGSFLLINIARIIILSFMFIKDSPFFDITHEVFWYLGSTLFVVGIWFLSVYLFKIREIPFYDDLRYLYDRSIFRNKKVKRK